MDYTDIENCQQGLKTLPIKGKDYVLVNERVKAFRKLFPDGFIRTDIISLDNGIVTIKAEVGADNTVLATGTAQEKETSSYINKTSYIENCETSAVGRALGFLGIGIDAGIASAEELQNAINNQTGQEYHHEDKKLICDDCGVEITGFSLKGVMYMAEDVFKTSYEKYGKHLCRKCCSAHKEIKNES